MKKLLVVIMVGFLAVMILEPNLVFADEVDDAISEFWSTFREGLSERDDHYGLIICRNAISRLDHVEDSRTIEALISALEEVRSNYRWNGSAKDQTYIDIGDQIDRSLVKIIDNNSNQVDGIIPILSDLFEDGTSIRNYSYGRDDFPFSSIATCALVTIAKNDPSKLDKIEDILLEAVQLGDGDKWYMTRHAAWALGEIGSEKAIPYLLDALHSSHWITVKHAVNALGKITVSENVDLDSETTGRITDMLINVLRDNLGRREEIVTAAIDSMSRIAVKYSSEVDKVAPVLVEMLGESEQDVARKANYGLRAIGGLAVPYIIEVFQESSDKEYCFDMIDVLINMEDSYAIEYLAEVLSDRNIDSDIRGEIVSRLLSRASYRPENSLYPNPWYDPELLLGIIPDLISLLGDETEFLELSSSRTICQRAADVLWAIGEPVVLPLQDFIRSGEGNEIALEWSVKILEMFNADIPKSSTSEDGISYGPIGGVYGDVLGLGSSTFM